MPLCIAEAERRGDGPKVPVSRRVAAKSAAGGVAAPRRCFGIDIVAAPGHPSDFARNARTDRFWDRLLTPTAVSAVERSYSIAIGCTSQKSVRTGASPTNLLSAAPRLRARFAFRSSVARSRGDAEKSESGRGCFLSDSLNWLRSTAKSRRSVVATTSRTGTAYPIAVGSQRTSRCDKLKAQSAERNPAPHGVGNQDEAAIAPTMPERRPTRRLLARRAQTFPVGPNNIGWALSVSADSLAGVKETSGGSGKEMFARSKLVQPKSGFRFVFETGNKSQSSVDSLERAIPGRPYQNISITYVDCQE